MATHTSLVKAKIIPVGFDPSTPVCRFLLNPETWTESKDAHWAKHNVPGLSDPIQQWTYGGARTISFQALITRDFSPSDQQFQTSAPNSNTSGKTTIVSTLQTIALQASGISLPTTIQTAQTQQGNLNLDITDKLNFYKSLLYPNISGKGGRVIPPNPVRLSLGSIYGKRTQNALFVVDRVEINITKSFPDLTPIEATVSFTLTELADKTTSTDVVFRNG